MDKTRQSKQKRKENDSSEEAHSTSNTTSCSETDTTGFWFLINKVTVEKWSVHRWYIDTMTGEPPPINKKHAPPRDLEDDALSAAQRNQEEQEKLHRQLQDMLSSLGYTRSTHPGTARLWKKCDEEGNTCLISCSYNKCIVTRQNETMRKELRKGIKEVYNVTW